MTERLPTNLTGFIFNIFVLLSQTVISNINIAYRYCKYKKFSAKRLNDSLFNVFSIATSFHVGWQEQQNEHLVKFNRIFCIFIHKLGSALNSDLLIDHY
jgi:hypothetical protein